MNAPFDPDETHGGEHDEQLLDANSMTWGTVDPDFDESFRERLGPLPIMSTPPYAFERVLVAGRRRRARKVWSGAAAAAFVVMAGTAGTTVALNGGSSASGPTIGPAGTRTTVSSPAVSPSASPSATTPTPSPAATTATGGSTSSAAGAGAPTGSATTSAGTPWCESDSFKLTVSTQSTTSAATAELIIVLTNTSGHTCTTYGFPGLELETQSGQLQSTTVTREKASSVQRLTVPAGDSISTTATYTSSTATETGSTGCGAPSYFLAVIPPNEQTQIVEPIDGAPITVCGSGELDTDPFAMGSSGN